MAATHAADTSIASSSNAAAATKTGSVIDLTACYGAGVTARITNGATGPTVGATVNVYVSNDNNVTPRILYSVTAGVANNGVYDFAFSIDPWWMYVRVDVTGNTVQAVTCEALVHKLTGI